jgi:aspartate/tyrosine/aromatic aminotransferase
LALQFWSLLIEDHRLNEIKAMSDRLRSVREKLYDLLANKLKTPGNWIHLKKSAGLYA